MHVGSSMIAVEHVTKNYRGGAGNVVALDNVSLDIAPGEFIALLGPSGCGKSTLLRLIADLAQPSSGTIQIKGKPAAQARLDRDYGMVFQAPVLYDWRTVQRNVELPLEIMGRAKAERAAQASAMLELVGLSDFAKAYPAQLSGGMQQRVAIARALVFAPQILLMDEPFGALDELTREQMQQELLQIWARTNATVIFVTHSIPEAVFLADRVVVMSPRPGRIAAIVPIDLPRPRDEHTRTDPQTFILARSIREHLQAH